MQALIQFFIELCLLRRGPQDLPASSTLLGATLVADLTVGLLVGLAAGLTLGVSLLQVLAELAILLAALYGALSLRGHLARFTQTATALLGTGALIGLIAIAPLGLSPTGSEQTDGAALGAVLLLALMVWSIVVTGHILRHSLNLTQAQGTLIALGFEILAILIMGGLFGGA